MLLLDEPFGALDAFTREELWCILRDLQAAQKFNVSLVTHDLRESIFLADTVYVMSKSPRRFVVQRHIVQGAGLHLPQPAADCTAVHRVQRAAARCRLEDLLGHHAGLRPGTLAFAGLVTIGAMAMAMYELFSWVEKRTTGWAHRGSQGGE